MLVITCHFMKMKDMPHSRLRPLSPDVNSVHQTPTSLPLYYTPHLSSLLFIDCNLKKNRKWIRFRLNDTRLQRSTKFETKDYSRIALAINCISLVGIGVRLLSLSQGSTTLKRKLRTESLKKACLNDSFFFINSLLGFGVDEEAKIRIFEIVGWRCSMGRQCV